MTDRLVLEAKGIVKHFGHVTALDGTDFELRASEILGLIGDNGAGKSTLIKALSGALVPDRGEIFVDGARVHFRSPSDARRAGIETLYQELAVAPALSIVENLFMGRELRRPGFPGHVLRMLDKRRMLEESTAYMQELGIGVRSMKQAVETLSGGQRQGVAVARSAASGCFQAEPRGLMPGPKGVTKRRLVERTSNPATSNALTRPAVFIRHHWPGTGASRAQGIQRPTRSRKASTHSTATSSPAHTSRNRSRARIGSRRWSSRVPKKTTPNRPCLIGSRS